jgi:hypothetical protein
MELQRNVGLRDAFNEAGMDAGGGEELGEERLEIHFGYVILSEAKNLRLQSIFQKLEILRSRSLP